MLNIDARAPAPGALTLTITEEQASALAAILANVGGTVRTTRRGLVQPIYEALVANGILYHSDDIAFTGGRAPIGCLVFEPRETM